MKWYQLGLLTVSVLLASTAWSGQDADNQNKQNEQKSPDQLALHQKPNQSSKVIDKLQLSKLNHYVPFHKQENWVKVGDRDSGQVGWINKQSYKKLMHQAMKPEVHTQYVYSTEKDGKPVIHAFENGKKLSEKQAKKVYKTMRKEMKQQQKQFKQQWHQFNKQFEQLNKQFNKMFHSGMTHIKMPFDSLDSES